MNEQLQQALAAILNSTTDSINVGTVFLQTQLPDVIQQILMWYMIKSIVASSIVALLLIILSVVAYRISIKPDEYEHNYMWEWDDDKHTLNPVSLLKVFITYCVVIGAGIFFISDCVQIWIAPKLWLIEYAAHLTQAVK